MDGEKLFEHIEGLGLKKEQWLAITSFSQSKMYSLFKQAKIKQADKKQVIKDFSLPADFFEDTETPVVVLGFEIEKLLESQKLNLDEREELAGLREKVQGMENLIKEKDKLIRILEKQVK